MVSTLKSDLMQSLMGELASLKQHGATATTATERRRWQVLVLLASGKTRQDISAATGYSLRTIRSVIEPMGLQDSLMDVSALQRPHCSQTCNSKRCAQHYSIHRKVEVRGQVSKWRNG
jgi:uncharacterized protein YerC